VRGRQQKTHSKIRRTKQNVQGHETIIAAKSESSDWDVACGMLRGIGDGNVCRVGAITAGPKEPSQTASESGRKLSVGTGIPRAVEGNLICKHKFQSFCKWNVQMQTNKTTKHNTANGRQLKRQQQEQQQQFLTRG